MARKKYEDVKLYTDVTKKEIKADKKNLLKHMSMAGNAGMDRIAEDYDRIGTFDRHDAGFPKGKSNSKRGIINSLDAERDAMMGGLGQAYGKQATSHSKEMDRMAARNLNYMDALPHAAKLAGNASKERIAAMKLAAQARAGGGGGGGGGGSTGSTGGTIPVDAADQASAAMSRLDELMVNASTIMSNQGADDFAIGSLADSMARNPDAALAVDQGFAAGMANGGSYGEISLGLSDALEAQGYNPTDAYNIVQTVGQSYRGETNPGYSYSPYSTGAPMSDFFPGANDTPLINPNASLSGLGPSGGPQGPVQAPRPDSGTYKLQVAADNFRRQFGGYQPRKQFGTKPAAPVLPPAPGRSPGPALPPVPSRGPR